MNTPLDAIFQSVNAFDAPFRPSIPARLLLWPTTGYVLTRRQFEALAHAATLNGDTGAECVITDRLVPDVEHEPRLRIQLADYASYERLAREVPLMLENAIIADRGDWAVLIGEEFHAVLGGPRAFLEAFRAAYPEGEGVLARFVTAWQQNADRSGANVSWLPGLLRHLGADPRDYGINDSDTEQGGIP